MGSVCRYYILTKHKSQKIMKVLAFAALAAVGIAQNDDIDEKKFNHMFQMVWSQVEPKTSMSNREIKNLIRNYGCYCLPIGTRANTALMGPPVDAYDKACKDLTRCYKCLDMDYEVNPSEDRFRWGYSTDNEIQCNDGRNSEAQKLTASATPRLPPLWALCGTTTLTTELTGTTEAMTISVWTRRLFALAAVARLTTAVVSTRTGLPTTTLMSVRCAAMTETSGM